MNKEMHTLKVT